MLADAGVIMSLDSWNPGRRGVSTSVCLLTLFGKSLLGVGGLFPPCHLVGARNVAGVP